MSAEVPKFSIDRAIPSGNKSGQDVAKFRNSAPNLDVRMRISPHGQTVRQNRADAPAQMKQPGERVGWDQETRSPGAN